MYKRIFRFGGVSLFLGLEVVSLFLLGSHSITVPCLFHLLTGLVCPACGMTRSLLALANGNIRASFSFNLFGIPCCLLALYYWYQLGKRYILKGEFVSLEQVYSRRGLLLFLGVFLGYGFVRNFSVFH